MSQKKLRCHCAGWPACQLCHGTGKYDYQPDDQGYMPFTCPTCHGLKVVADDATREEYRCKTCKGDGFVDPGNPAVGGLADVLTKILFGV
jgi:DnaJ-class molecular chaperone